MRHPKWICSECGIPFTRKWNALRHSNNRHNGIPVVVSFMEYLSRRDGRIYPPTSPPTYGPREKNLFDVWKEEFNNSKQNYYRRLARQILDNFFNPNAQRVLFSPQYQPQHQQYHTNNNDLHGFESGSSRSFIKRRSFAPANPDEIFGYTGFVCEDCLQTVIDTLPFMLTDEQKAIISKHVCDPKMLEYSHKLDNTNKQFLLAELQDQLPSHIKELVLNNWTKYQNYLLAIKHTNTQASYIELSSCNEDHWAARAIKNKQTLLSDTELTDFLNKVRNATFAVFKIKMKGSEDLLYMLMVTNNPSKFLPFME
jgi:hypothetical protein